MLQTNVVEKMKTRFMFSNFLFFRKTCHLSDYVESIVETGRSQITKWHMHIACCMPKAIPRICRTVYPLQQLLHKCASVLRCTYIAFLVPTCTFPVVVNTCMFLQIVVGVLLFLYI